MRTPCRVSDAVIWAADDAIIVEYALTSGSCRRIFTRSAIGKWQKLKQGTDIPRLTIESPEQLAAARIRLESSDTGRRVGRGDRETLHARAALRA
jgi:hypothetical protein